MLLTILGIIGAIIGLLGALSAVWAFVKNDVGRNVIDLQKTEIDTLTGKVSRLEQDKAAICAERDSLKEQVASLKDLVQGSPQLQAMADAIAALTSTLNKFMSKGRRNGTK